MFGVIALNCFSEATHRKFTNLRCADLFNYEGSRSFRVNAASMVVCSMVAISSYMMICVQKLYIIINTDNK